MADAKEKGPCKGAAKHRTAQKKYVKGNKDKHAAAVKRNYNKQRAAILAKKRKARKKKTDHKSGGKRTGRPRKC
jgi:hypothetical protein